MSGKINYKRVISPSSGSGGGGGGSVNSVNSGMNIIIDNTDPANPIVNFSGTYQAPIIVAANYTAILALPPITGKFYWASSSQGTSWLPGGLGGTYYSAGLYYCANSVGPVMQFLDVPYQATQAEVNTGTNDDKFVTPLTLTNATVITNKELLSNKSISVVVDQASDIKFPSVKSVYDWVVSLGYITLTADQIDAINNASVPTGANPFATLDDIPASGLTQQQVEGLI